MAPLLLVPGSAVLGALLGPVLELEPVVPLVAVFDVSGLDDPLDVAAVDPVVAALFCVFAVDELAANATDVPTPARAPVRTTPASSCFVRSFMVGLPRFFSGPWGTYRYCDPQPRTGCETSQRSIRRIGQLGDDR
jgi:hypothetical protein